MFKCSGHPDLLQLPHSSFKVNFFRTGSPIYFSQSSFPHSTPMSWSPGLINSSATFFTCDNHTCASMTNELLASSFCLSRFKTWEEVLISEMFIPTIYLSPTCPFMSSELLAIVCQSGKSSLANASLLASRFGKNRHCWKKCFSPLLCLSQVQSGQSISCD